MNLTKTNLSCSRYRYSAVLLQTCASPISINKPSPLFRAFNLLSLMICFKVGMSSYQEWLFSSIFPMPTTSAFIPFCLVSSSLVKQFLIKGSPSTGMDIIPHCLSRNSSFYQSTFFLQSVLVSMKYRYIIFFHSENKKPKSLLTHFFKASLRFFLNSYFLQSTTHALTSLTPHLVSCS